MSFKPGDSFFKRLTFCGCDVGRLQQHTGSMKNPLSLSGNLVHLGNDKPKVFHLPPGGHFWHQPLAEDRRRVLPTRVKMREV